nr:immunoglobulin light chain junction region [Macaca mulatta]MOX71179.1 immunoglobulin light chain junction region [Macaca mulatta]MOX72987.1 immunoglobulin light chain junction region [Macaca mulatta]MOX74927.1 immunoglobulin light chain junction region [Macaca mulatta]
EYYCCLYYSGAWVF